MISGTIDRRADANSNDGLHTYGDLEFADPVNHKYAIDTPSHVRAAWSYIHQHDNATRYGKDDVKQIKQRIKRAARQHSVELRKDD